MAIAFDRVDPTRRVPLFTAEFHSGTPPFSLRSVSIIAAQITSGALATVGQMYLVGGADGEVVGGPGSHATAMIDLFRRTNYTGDLYLLPVANPVGAAAATGTITITGPATDSGQVVVFIGGKRVAVAVTSGASATSIAAAIVSAIGEGTRRFGLARAHDVTASNTAGVVTLTARVPGALGNEIRLEQHLDGREPPPAGVTVAFSASTLTGGSGDVDLAAALANIGSAACHHLVTPYATTTQLDAARDFFADTGAGRWSPSQLQYGHHTTAKTGSLGALTSFGLGRNDQHATCLAARGVPNPPWEIAGALGGVVSFSKNLGRPLDQAVEIARPLQTLELPGIRPPANEADRWSIADQESLLRAGMSTFGVSEDGTVRLSRVITMYRKNAAGQDDVNWLNLSSVMLTAYFGLYMRSRVESTFPRHVIKDRNPANVQGVTTPEDIRDFVIAVYRELELAALYERGDEFARYVRVERSAEGNRVNVFAPIDVANELNIFAARVETYTEYQAVALRAA